MEEKASETSKHSLARWKIHVWKEMKKVEPASFLMAQIYGRREGSMN